MSDNVGCAVVLGCTLIGVLTNLTTGVVALAAAVFGCAVLVFIRGLWRLGRDHRRARRLCFIESKRHRALREIKSISRAARRRMLDIEREERRDQGCRQIERRGW